LHVPVALNIEGEFFAAVIAAQSMGWPKLLLGAGNMRENMGAHHKPPASARPCSTLDLRFVNPQPCFEIEIVPERCPKSTHQENESGYFYLT
jgi:hypothetical protein